VLAADRLHPRPVAGRRHHHPARAHQRLADEGGDGARALAFDHRFQLGQQAGGERGFRLALQPEAVEMRAGQMHDRDRRQVEIAVVVGQAGQAARGDGDAVITLGAGEELLLGRAAKRVVHVPDQLDHGVIRLGARVGVEHPGQRFRADLHQLLGQPDRGFMRLGGEDVIVGQLGHLLVGGIGEALLAKAHRDRPQPRQPLDILVASRVPDMDALAAGDDDRAVLFQRAGIGIGMQAGGKIGGDKRVGEGGVRGIHGGRSFCPAASCLG